MYESAIYAKGLVKRFGKLVAVDGIDLDIRTGECFGFLGPNGAGKTTIMRMMSCISPVTEGELWVNNKNVNRDSRLIKQNLGVVSQDDSLDSNLSVLQNLQVHARYFNIPSATARQRALQSLELFQLGERANSKVDELSGGMKRRLLLARALLQNPKLLILDEPTTGLDPQARNLVWQRIHLLKSQMITIVLSTHYMEEATYLCDRIAIMDSGQIVAQGSPSDLIHQYAGGEVVEIQVGLDQDTKQSVMRTLLDLGLQPEDGGERIIVYGSVASLSEKELGPINVFRRPGNLEDVFLRLTGRGLQED
jgi:lipooligosaccharide transport system ATP-binding protein